MKQYTKSIMFLLSASLLTSTNLSASGEAPIPPSTALVPVKPVSGALSREVRSLEVPLPDGTTQRVFRSCEILDQKGRGATVTFSATSSAPGAVNGGALVAVLERDWELDRPAAPAAPTAAGALVRPSMEQKRRLMNVYSGVKGIQMQVVRLEKPTYKYPNSIMQIYQDEPGLLEITNSLNSFANGDIKRTLAGLSTLIKRKQESYGDDLINRAIKQIPPLVDKVLAFIDGTDLAGLIAEDISPLLPILNSIIDTCEEYIDAEGIEISDQMKSAVILEGVPVSAFLDASIQIERVIHTIGRPGFLQEQKDNIETLERFSKEPFRARLSKELRDLNGLTAFRSKSHPDFNELEKGVIAINGLLESIIGYLQPTSLILRSAAGRARLIEDFKSTPFMLADGPSSASSTAALTTLTRIKATPTVVTDSRRLTTLEEKARSAATVIPSSLDDLQNQIERSNAYLGIAALTDGITDGGSGAASSDAMVTVRK